MEYPLDFFLFNQCSSDLCKAAQKVLSGALTKLRGCSLLNELAEKSEIVEINIVVSDAGTVKKLNLQFRGVDSSTDVLTFPLGDGSEGEVWLCPEVISDNAARFEEKFEIELTRILIHGVLHLLGYDHKDRFLGSGKSKEEMFRLQEKILSEIV